MSVVRAHSSWGCHGDSKGWAHKDGWLLFWHHHWFCGMPWWKRYGKINEVLICVIYKKSTRLPTFLKTAVMNESPKRQSVVFASHRCSSNFQSPCTFCLAKSVLLTFCTLSTYITPCSKSTRLEILLRLRTSYWQPSQNITTNDTTIPCTVASSSSSRFLPRTCTCIPEMPICTYTALMPLDFFSF
jgi:hypothetical protein